MTGKKFKIILNFKVLIFIYALLITVFMDSRFRGNDTLGSFRGNDTFDLFFDSVFAQEVSSTSSPSAKELYEKGYAAQSQGNIEAAVAFYLQTITVDPSYALAYNNLGIIAERKGNLDKAIEYYNKCLRADPKCISAYSNLAFVYEGKGDYNNAIRAWKKRVELGNPADPWTQKAQQRLQELLAQMPAQVPTQVPTGVPAKTQDKKQIVSSFLDKFNKGGAAPALAPAPTYTKAAADIEAERKKLESEKARIKEILTKLPSIAELEKENKYLNERVKTLSTALSREKEGKDKEAAVIYEKLGTAYIKGKLYSEAIDAYRKSLAFDSDNPKIYYYLGLLHQYKNKDSRQAVECFREYLELDPHGDHAEKANDFIKILEQE
jgi:tetratricopeptide (TPR) repeat protein